MCMIFVVVYYLLRFSTKSIVCQVYVRQFHFRSCSFVKNALAVDGRKIVNYRERFSFIFTRAYLPSKALHKRTV